MEQSTYTRSYSSLVAIYSGIAMLHSNQATEP